VLAGSIVSIGCRSLKIHRVEFSVVGGKHIHVHRAAGNLMIASPIFNSQEIEKGITRNTQNCH
jgi:hypothetical protein